MNTTYAWEQALYLFVFYKTRYENASEGMNKDAEVFPVTPYVVAETSAASSLSWFLSVSILYSQMKSRNDISTHFFVCKGQ